MTYRPGVDLSLAELLSMRVYRTRSRSGAQSRRTDGLAINQAVSRGLDVSEVRRYQHGDEVRAIDWKVTARRGETHVKVFEDERARPVYLLVDLRRGLHFGTRVCFKSVLAARLAAGLGWRALHAGDRVGAWLLTQSGVKRLRDVADEAGVKRLCHALVRHHSAGESDDTTPLADHFGAMARGQFGKAEWHVISDFADCDPAPTLPKKVAVACWHLVDPLDTELPPRSGWVRDRDGLRRISVSKRARHARREHHQSRVAALKSACGAANHRYLELSTVNGEIADLRRMLSAGLGT